MVINYMRDVQTNLQKIDKLSTQINTQQEVNNVSDDPYKAIKIMNLKNEIATIDKYNMNCDEIGGWVTATDDALANVGELATEMKLLLTKVSGTLGEAEVSALVMELNGKLEEIGNALNTTYVGNNIFSGSATDEKPILIEKDAQGLVTLKVNPNVNNDKLKADISGGVQIDYNMDVTTALGAHGLDTLNEVVSMFKNPATVDMNKITEMSKKLDVFVENNLSMRSLVGSKGNTINAIKDANENGKEKLKGTYSLLQDVNVIEKYVELSTAQMVYTSSMKIGSNLLQPSLLDYIR